jgi:uncharacterized membrane protein YhdT
MIAPRDRRLGRALGQYALDLKRKRIADVLKGRDYSLGWVSAQLQAQGERRRRRWSRRKSRRTTLKTVLSSHRVRWGLVLSLCLIAGWRLISVGYNREWSGWRSKTLWDWMTLFIVPMSLAIIAYLFGRQEHKTDRDIAAEQHQQKLLQDYFDRISKFILDNQLDASESDGRIRAIARLLTLSVLRRSDVARRSEILRFLYEAKLIQRASAIIDLHGF